MYAVIRTGGRQQKVRAGEVIEVDYMDVDPGSAVEFQPILVVDDEGRPHVGRALAEAKVVATLLGDSKAEKVRVFKYRPKSGYRRTQGHRQLMTVLEVQEVVLGPGRVSRKEAAGEPAPAAEAEAEAPAAEKPAAKKAAAKKPAAKKPAAKKPPAKKPAARKAAAKKPAAKKPAARRSTRKPEVGG